MRNGRGRGCHKPNGYRDGLEQEGARRSRSGEGVSQGIPQREALRFPSTESQRSVRCPVSSKRALAERYRICLKPASSGLA